MCLKVTLQDTMDGSAVFLCKMTTKIWVISKIMNKKLSKVWNLVSVKVPTRTHSLKDNWHWIIQVFWKRLKVI